MIAKITDGITERWASCRFLLAALMRQGPTVAGRLLVHVQPHLLEGDGEPGFLTSIGALGRRLGASVHTRGAFAQTRYASRAKLNALRARREELAVSLGKEIVRMRRTVMSQYLDPDLKQLGLESPRSYRPDPVSRQADLIEEAFARESVGKLLGEPFYEDPFDAAKTVAPLHRVNGDLRSNLDLIDDQVRLYDELFLEKEELKKEHDVLFTYTARTFEGYCRLAGLEKLAERVRPSTKRPGRLASQPPTNPPGNGAGDAAEDSAHAEPDSEEQAPVQAGSDSEVTVPAEAEPDSEATAPAEPDSE